MHASPRSPAAFAASAALALATAGEAGGCGGPREDPVAGRRPPAATDRGAAATAPATPPPPPFHPLDAARLDALAALDEPGFTVVHRDRTATSLVVALTSTETPVRALVTIGPCLQCRAMDVAAWQAALPELRALMPGALEDDPDSRFELDAVEVAGRTCVATWELGAVAYGDDIEASHAARIYCNDGAVELTVRVDDDDTRRAASVDDARRGAVRAVVEDPARRLAARFAAAM
ncbi:MAG: hypothetical protein H6708_32180 [Kofleriaceae bacterium]|nr:hypothetical protein [Kofleriaceae bacterium]